MILKPIRNENDLNVTLERASRGFNFLNDLEKAASELNMLQGTLSRYLLPFNNKTSVADQAANNNNEFGSSSSSHSGLASAKLIIPAKQKLSFGISFNPLFSREITIMDSTYNEFIFAGTDTLDYSRSNRTGGGSSMAQLAVGYKLSDTDDIGVGLDVIFGSSRSSQNLIIDSDDHLLQSRDYFSGSLVELYYTTSRFSLNENPLILSLNYNFSLNDIDIESESYQAFLDLNSNNYHDSQDYPTVAAALMPTNTEFKNEISISEFKATPKLPGFGP